jgi:hypothetical protein
MKKAILVFGCTIIFLFTACKKKETTPDVPATNTTTTGGGNFVYSYMATAYNITDYNNSITLDSSVTAQFYTGPAPAGPPQNVLAGIVALNTFSLNPESDNSYFSSSPNMTTISGPLNWSVSGSGDVAAFSYSYMPVYPKYTGGSLLQDTCTKSNGISINISGVTDYTTSALSSGLTVMLVQSSIISKPIFGTSGGTVTFSPAELTGFSTNSPITIFISIVNFNTVPINGVNRNFNCELTYQKYAYLK